MIGDHKVWAFIFLDSFDVFRIKVDAEMLHEEKNLFANGLISKLQRVFLRMLGIFPHPAEIVDDNLRTAGR
jgi:hypothetical protein